MSSNKKKLLILIDWFVPGFRAGGPVQSCVNICRLLSKQYDVYVLTTDTDHGTTEPYKNITANKWIKNKELGVQVFYAAKKTISLKQVKEQIAVVNADTVYLNLLFSFYLTLYPLWLKFRGVIKSKVVLCPRGTLYESALDVKRYKKTPVLALLRSIQINRLVRFHATNQREQEAVLHYFPGSEVMIANNLPDINQPSFSSIENQLGRLNAVFVARVVPIKNLLFVLNCLKQATGNIHLSIIGPVEDSLYWQACRQVMEQLPEHISVQYHGAKEPGEIKAMLQQHHVFILPTKGENFGHAIFESLLAGRPVLISDQTPWRNLQEEKAGWDIALNEPGQFIEVINYLTGCNQEIYDQYAKGAWNYTHRFINVPGLVKPYQLLFE